MSCIELERKRCGGGGGVWGDTNIVKVLSFIPSSSVTALSWSGLRLAKSSTNSQVGSISSSYVWTDDEGFIRNLRLLYDSCHWNGGFRSSTASIIFCCFSTSEMKFHVKNMLLNKKLQTTKYQPDQQT